MGCINTLRFMVLGNDQPHIFFFESNKCIRQGDLIYPFFFIIMVRVLRMLISRKKIEGQWKGIWVVEGIDFFNPNYNM